MGDPVDEEIKEFPPSSYEGERTGIVIEPANSNARGNGGSSKRICRCGLQRVSPVCIQHSLEAE
jgi:hypothetical protein